MAVADPNRRTVVHNHLLNSYKHRLVKRRLLQTATGGLKLQKAPYFIHVFQLLVYLTPIVIAAPSIILSALDVWNEYFTSLFHSCIHVLVVFVFRMAEYCIRRKFGNDCRPSSAQSDDEDMTDTEKSFGDMVYLIYVIPKNIIYLCIHSIIASGLLSFASSYILAPKVLTEYFSIPVTVVVCTWGLLVTCNAHYSLNIHQPRETAVYRPTDRLELKPLLRATHIICVFLGIISIR